MENKIITKHCIGCGDKIHPKRVEILPTTKTCVGCSTTGIKRGVTVLNGDVNKDDTWVDIVFLEPDDYSKYNKEVNKFHKITKKSSKAEIQNYEDDDNQYPSKIHFPNSEE
jgi:hypothetical protein